MKDKKLILWFDEIELNDIPQVGGKNASLGEMRRELISKGVNVPDGFAVTAFAYRSLIESAALSEKIRQVLVDLDTHDIENLAAKGRQIRALIYGAEFPADLKTAILAADVMTGNDENCTAWIMATRQAAKEAAAADGSAPATESRRERRVRR